MSQGIGFATILGCLDAGEKLLGLDPQKWRIGPNPHDACGRDRFLTRQSQWRAGLNHFDPKKLRSFATSVHPDVLVKAEEWKMRLDDLPDGGMGAIYMISQLRELLSWLSPGKREIYEWPEFVLEKGVRFYKMDVCEKIVVEVPVEGGDRVYMTRYNQPKSGLGLYQIIDTIESVMAPNPDSFFTSVQVPCVSADIEADLSWIVGIRNDDYFISYAQQKILFGMNEKGFAVREETGMVARFTSILPKAPYRLSPNGESFLFWRRRPGVEFPISMFQFTREDFVDPGDLNKIVE